MDLRTVHAIARETERVLRFLLLILLLLHSLTNREAS
jgi:hypothetical protein